MGLHPTKLEEIARSAVILRISMAKPHVAAGINSPSTNNEKRTIQAQRDFLKREQSKPEHKALNRYVEVAISDMHRIQADYIPVNRGSLHFPAAADNPGWMRWSPEDGEGGLRRVLLPRPLVRRKATMKSTEAMRYSLLVKPERKSKATRRFLKNKENQQTQFDKPTASYTTHPPTASQTTEQVR